MKDKTFTLLKAKRAIAKAISFEKLKAFHYYSNYKSGYIWFFKGEPEGAKEAVVISKRENWRVNNEFNLSYEEMIEKTLEVLRA